MTQDAIETQITDYGRRRLASDARRAVGDLRATNDPAALDRLARWLDAGRRMLSLEVEP